MISEQRSLRYQHVRPITQQEAEQRLASSELEAIANTLVRIAVHEPDWRWAQEKILEFTYHPNTEVRGLSAICLGHIARIHRILDLSLVRPVLRDMLKDPEVAGQAQDALEDIRKFVPWRIRMMSILHLATTL